MMDFLCGNESLLFQLLVQLKIAKMYKESMLAFNKYVIKFHAAGKQTFLTKNAESTGNDETFYLNCLCFYIPKLPETTFKEHNLGVRIFTIQGFKQRKKVSKNVLKRFGNGLMNIVVSI